MKLIVKNISDGEYERFEIKFRSTVSDAKGRLESFFHAWVGQRAEKKLCACWFKQLDVTVNRRGDGANVLFGWSCPTCWPNLADELSRAIPEVDKVTIGQDKGGYPAPRLGFRDVPAKTVEFEDGRKVDVAPFSIAWSPVTVGQFEEFAKANSYVTSAEQQERRSFRNNPCVEAASERTLGNAPARCVSYLDAAAYCTWADVRLPTEAEWLAAALIDERIFDERGQKEFLFGTTGRFDRRQHPTALDDLGPEWVHGIYRRDEWEAILKRELSPNERQRLQFQEQFDCAVANERAVVRHGPQLIREIGWNDRLQRSLVRVDSSDIMTGFRVVRCCAAGSQ